MQAVEVEVRNARSSLCGQCSVTLPLLSLSGALEIMQRNVEGSRDPATQPGLRDFAVKPTVDGGRMDRGLVLVEVPRGVGDACGGFAVGKIEPSQRVGDQLPERLHGLVGLASQGRRRCAHARSCVPDVRDRERERYATLRVATRDTV